MRKLIVFAIVALSGCTTIGPGVSVRSLEYNGIVGGKLGEWKVIHDETTDITILYRAGARGAFFAQTFMGPNCTLKAGQAILRHGEQGGVEGMVK